MSYKFTDLRTGVISKDVNLTFKYKGYEVSMSNCGYCATQVGVFHEQGQNFNIYFDSVEQAIEFINGVVK